MLTRTAVNHPTFRLRLRRLMRRAALDPACRHPEMANMATDGKLDVVYDNTDEPGRRFIVYHDNRVVNHLIFRSWAR